MKSPIMIALALLAPASAGAQTAQQESIFTVGQQIEMRVSAGGWRKCTVTDQGGEYRLARADCEEFPTPRYTYPAGEDSFNAQGSADVRLPGTCVTTSPYLNQRKINYCTAAAPQAAAPAPPPADVPAPAPTTPPAAAAPMAPAGQR